MICLLLSPIVTAPQYDTEPADTPLMNCNVNFSVIECKRKRKLEIGISNLVEESK